jgi:hypothetical protein
MYRILSALDANRHQTGQSRNSSTIGRMTPQVIRFSPADRPGGRDPSSPFGDGEPTPQGDDLPYRVEVWDEAGAHVDLIVAVSLSPAIGYAAFYAATREYPGRAITLRHKSRVLSRWTAQTH